MLDAALHTPLHTHDADAPIARNGERVEAVGAVVMRCGLGLVFLWFGAMKFTSYEATSLGPFVMNSPLVSWWHALLGIQGTSYMLGVFEMVAGALLLAGFVRPLLGAVGGAMGVVTFLITLSFLFSTPGVAEPLAGGFPALSAVPGQFLLKDLGLLGISLFLMGESLLSVRKPAASRQHPLEGSRKLGADQRFLERTRADAAGAVATGSTGNQSELDARILQIGGAVLRYGLALIFLWFGCMKFTSYEATGVAPFIMNSPLVGWWHAVLGIQGASYMLGVFEVITGILLALYKTAPRAAAVGGAMAVLTFLITLSFFLTTPGVAAPMGFPAISGNVGGFLLKDAGLLGISIWLLGEALLRTAVRASAPSTSRE